MLGLMGVGDRLRIAREAANLSQRAIANHIGTVTQTVYRYEKGKTTPRERTLRSIADLLGVSYAWLVSGKEGSTPASALAAEKAFSEWLATPLGKSASEQERDLVRGVSWGGGVPTNVSFDRALEAFRMTLPVDEVLIE